MLIMMFIFQLHAEVTDNHVSNIHITTFTYLRGGYNNWGKSHKLTTNLLVSEFSYSVKVYRLVFVLKLLTVATLYILTPHLTILLVTPLLTFIHFFERSLHKCIWVKFVAMQCFTKERKVFILKRKSKETLLCWIDPCKCKFMYQCDSILAGKRNRRVCG